MCGSGMWRWEVAIGSWVQGECSYGVWDAEKTVVVFKRVLTLFLAWYGCPRVGPTCAHIAVCVCAVGTTCGGVA